MTVNNPRGTILFKILNFKKKLSITQVYYLPMEFELLSINPFIIKFVFILGMQNYSLSTMF